MSSFTEGFLLGGNPLEKIHQKYPILLMLTIAENIKIESLFSTAFSLSVEDALKISSDTLKIYIFNAGCNMQLWINSHSHEIRLTVLKAPK